MGDILDAERSYAPYSDIYETDDNYILVSSMPGISRENIQIKLEDGNLVIFGKRADYKESLNRKYLLNENEIGHYFRKFKISDSVDDSKIEASFEKGQLVVTLPKHERVKPRTINIS